MSEIKTGIPEKGEKKDISSLTSNVIEKPNVVSSKTKREQVVFSVFSQGQATKNRDVWSPMICDVGYDRYFASHTLYI